MNLEVTEVDVEVFQADRALNENLSAALRLSEAGIPVFPVKLARSAFGRWRKSPCIRGWQEAATTDCDKIENMWDDFPEAVPGIALGRCGLVVIDTDRHTAGEDGVAAFASLTNDQQPLADHPVIATAGNGEHHYFRQPYFGDALGNSEGSLPAGINVRGRGGFVVAPGSIRPDGKRWGIEADVSAFIHSFKKAQIPPVEDWLVGLLRKPKIDIPQITVAVQRPDTNRENAYAAEVLKRCVDEVRQAPIGTRNNVLNSCAYRLGRVVGRGWIEESVVKSALYEACHANGLIGSDGHHSVNGTIQSGLNAGRDHPHPDLVDRPNDKHTFESPPPSPLLWDGDDLPPRPPYSVSDLIPKNSVGLLIGESQTAKTLLAIHLASSTALGAPFFSKNTRQGGTLLVAAEGWGTIPGRFKAARLAATKEFEESLSARQKSGLPIAAVRWDRDLLEDDSVRYLIECARDASAQMQKEFGLPLQTIIIDTLLAAFCIDNWNDSASTSQVMNILKKLATETGATIIGIHHHGKDPSRGPAGSYALTAASDFNLSVYKDSDGGVVSRRWLSLTKQRDGETGWTCEFDLDTHSVGSDVHGDEIRVAYVVPKVETAGLGRPKKTKDHNRSTLALLKSLEKSSLEFGQEIYSPDGKRVRAVTREKLREIFKLNYEPDSKAKDANDAVRSAFKRALSDCRRGQLIGQVEASGIEHFWRKAE